MAKTFYIPKKLNTSEIEHDKDLDAKRVIDARARNTSFGENVIGWRTSKFNFKPTWGKTKLRDKEIVTGSGTIIEVDGEYKISTGTTAGSIAELTTRERGQYQAGTQGEMGIGIRFPSGLLPLVNSEEIRWEFSDDNNGFGYGVDANGLFIFRVKKGVFSRDYQQDWRYDTLDGEGDLENPSGVNLDIEIGNIFQLDFVWYGYGTIEFYLNIKDPAIGMDKRILIHTIQVEGELSVIDPNQPISVYCDNGTSNRDVSVYVGGRQFSVVNGDSSTNTRQTRIPLIGREITSAVGTYEPVLAVRKKQLFRGRNNSVNCFTTSVSVSATNKIDWYLSIGDDTDGTWQNIPNVPADETAIEYNNDSTNGGTSQYRAIDGDVILANATSVANQTTSSRIPLGDDLQVVLWVSKRTGSNPTVDATIRIEEEW